MNNRYNKIAKNTSFLYIRMLVILSVHFYTIRVILDVLGVSDFGIYNVVASTVVMLAVLNNTLATGTQRFLTFEIGKNDYNKLQKIFSASVIIHSFLAVIVLIIGETIGLWFFYEFINIPADRLNASFWTYQFSLLSIMITISQVPYTALIIAHERMRVFAYISVAEAVLKLVMVYLLLIIQYDNLITYAVLMFLATLIIALFYRKYCHSNYHESHFKYVNDKQNIKVILNFSGWNIFGTLGMMVSTQGIAVLFNVFFGPAANAAYALAMQMNNGLNQFVNSFHIASTPQITKLYAENNISEMNKYIEKLTRYAFLLLWLLALPIFVKLEYILSIWLNKVPLHTVMFTEFLLAYGLMFSFLRPLSQGIQATGKNKGMQLTAGLLLIMILPMSYYFLANDFPIYTPFIVMLVIWCFHLSFALYFLNKYINFPILKFMMNSMLPVVLVTILSYFSVDSFANEFDASVIDFILFSLASFLINVILIYLLALDQKDKLFITNIVKKIIKL